MTVLDQAKNHVQHRCRPVLGRRAARKAKESKGQALAEALVVLLALLSIWVGLAWLARFQDITLQASHASRYAAFSLARGVETDPLPHIRRNYFSGPAHRWANRRGEQILSDQRQEIHLLRMRTDPIDANAQPGGSGEARALRESWRINDEGVLHAVVQFDPSGPSSTPEKGLAWGDGLRFFDRAYPTARRHTSILTGAGHAATDSDAQQRVAKSDSAWGASAAHTYGLALSVSARVQAVDAAWPRSAPTIDWISPWTSMVPSRHLSQPGDLP